MTDRCRICKKVVKTNTYIWYSGGSGETYLCLKHYRSWNRFYGNSFKKIKPVTKKWHNECVKAQAVFDKWVEEA